MLLEFSLYLSANLPENSNLALSAHFWNEVEELLQENRERPSLQHVQRTAMEGAHLAPFPADREGFKALYRFVARLRRSERVNKSARARKMACNRRAMYKQQLGGKLKKALK